MWLLLIPVALALLCLFRWNQRRLILPNLLDKYVLITGCDSGFGNLAAKQLDRRGMHVLAACLTKKGAENLKKETSSRLQTVILDVTDSQSVNAATAWAASIVGNKGLEEACEKSKKRSDWLLWATAPLFLYTGLWGVVNNAGISVPTAPNEWMTKEDFSKILNVNLLGVIDVTLKMLPLIRKARGRVVNVASIAGRLTICGGGYCPSKYGVESFSDSLRREMKPFGVKICIIEPGFFATQVTDAKIIKESINKLWARAPEEIRRSYGQKYYEEYCKITDLSLSLCNTKLSLVSDAMEHALTAVHPKTRYSAGWDAKLLYLPLSYLPAVITDFIIVSLFPKLSKVT